MRERGGGVGIDAKPIVSPGNDRIQRGAAVAAKKIAVATQGREGVPGQGRETGPYVA